MRKECYSIIHNSRVSYCFHPKKTGKFEIKHCMEDFALCINSMRLWIHE